MVSHHTSARMVLVAIIGVSLSLDTLADALNSERAHSNQPADPGIITVLKIESDFQGGSRKCAGYDGMSNLRPLGCDFQAPTIRLLNRSFSPPRGIEPGSQVAVDAMALRAIREGRSTIHVLVQLDRIPGYDERVALRQQGLDLQVYVPDRAWIAAIPANYPWSFAAISGFRWVDAWRASDKLHPRLTRGGWEPLIENALHKRWLMVFVQVHADVSLVRGVELARQIGGVPMPPVIGLHGMTVWLPSSQLMALSEQEEVLWIGAGPLPLSEMNDGVRNSMQVNEVQTTPYDLDGSGVRLLVFDIGTVLETHTTFNAGSGSRVTILDSEPARDHPTHSAGTAAGDGNDSKQKGVAPGVAVFSAGYAGSGGTVPFWDNTGDIETDYSNARVNNAIDLATNSLGSDVADDGYDCDRHGDYGMTAALIDGIVRGDNASVQSSVLTVWSAGNERTGQATGSPVVGRCGANYSTTGPPACAKNPIHVGAINSDGDSMTRFSSWGPCDDGRLKPLVVGAGCELGRTSGELYIDSSLSDGDDSFGGPGWCGTSAATAAVAGVLALMIEQWRDSGYGGPTDRPLPGLFRAVLMHTARDLGPDGPDFTFGYGEVDAQAAIDLIRSASSLGSSGKQWGADLVDQGETDSFAITVPPNAGELKVSLAWDDAAAAAFAAKALVNDLDLLLIDPGSEQHRPSTLNAASPHLEAIPGINMVDNQEQVLIEFPAQGVWTILVSGTTVPSGPQSYGLIAEAKQPDHDAASCVEQISNRGFEADTNGWSLGGNATRVAAPAPDHGVFSLRLGGSVNSKDSLYRNVTIQPAVARAELSFHWFMTTNESTASNGHGWDNFYVELTDNSGFVVLETLDMRSDAWPQGAWMHSANVDLTAFAGQTLRLQFIEDADGARTTSYYIDEVSLVTCLGNPLIFRDGFEDFE